MPSIRLRPQPQIQRNSRCQARLKLTKPVPQVGDQDISIRPPDGHVSSLCSGVRPVLVLMDLHLFPRRAAHYAIRAYQLSFSAFLGRQCRYLPSCSAYADEAIARYGLGVGGIMGFARICRCHPWGNYGFDPVPDRLPANSSWRTPWRYGQWRGPLHCEDAVSGEGAADKKPDAQQEGQGGKK